MCASPANRATPSTERRCGNVLLSTLSAASYHPCSTAKDVTLQISLTAGPTAFQNHFTPGPFFYAPLIQRRGERGGEDPWDSVSLSQSTLRSDPPRRCRSEKEAPPVSRRWEGGCRQRSAISSFRRPSRFGNDLPSVVS